MAKIIKNLTSSPVAIRDTGVVVPASSTYIIPPQDYLLWAASTNTVSYIDAGTLIVNDGEVDLNKINSKNLLSFYENEEGLMLARNLYEHTGFVILPTQCACERTTLSFNNANRTLTLSAKSPYTAIEFLYRDTLYQLAGPISVQIQDIEGPWFIYFDSNINLVASQTPFDFATQVFVAILYWDWTNKKHIKFLEERHGAIMDLMTHYVHHRTENTKIDTNNHDFILGNYILDGDGSSNAHATFSIADGDLFDEDIRCEIRHSDTPSADFEQYLTPIAKLPVFYMNGMQNWRRKDANNYSVVENPPGTAYYNIYSGGTWSLASCTDSWYFATWLVLTNDIEYPVCAILGQRQDSNLIEAINNNTRLGLQLPNFFSQEKYFLKKMVWQTSTSYTNTPKVRLVYISEATEINPANDRYAVICSYNGNAGVGKYLEFYPGLSSDTSPFPIPEISYIRTVTLGATSNSTGTISFYKSTDLVTPLFTSSLSNSKYYRMNLTYRLLSDDKLVAKVFSGSINKPQVTIFIQTSL